MILSSRKADRCPPARPRRIGLAALLALTVAGVNSLAAAPSNDAFVMATVLSGTSASDSASNSGAGKETGEPDHAGDVGGRSLWWEWTATFDGPVTFTTETSASNLPEGGQLDTLIAVYEGDGSSHASLSVIANDDDTGSNLSSLLILNAETGKKYLIAVDGKNGAAGDFHFCFFRGLPARIDDLERLGDGSTRLTITTAAACRLRIEANPDLSNPAGWTRVPSGRLNDQVGTFQFTDASSIGQDALFYRVSNP